MTERAVPIGGSILTRPIKVLAAVLAIGAVVIAWRLAFGLGAVSAMNDGYPLGLWIVFDVVTGTALACGGYAVALLVYILNKGRYHPLVRPAILTSALGYTIAGASVALDIGRPWAIWKVPVYFWHWNLDSVLLEVALCIMAYVFVLWIELSPAFLEKFREGEQPFLKRLAERLLPVLDRALVWIVALGILLPTMHQSSLGTLMLLSGPRLHPLWNTPLLPLLFLISCIGMGYAVVVFESALSGWLFRRRIEREMLAGLGGAMLPIMGSFVVLRVGDLWWRGVLATALTPSIESGMVALELLLIVAPLVMLASAAKRADMGRLFRAAMLLVAGGALYRFDVYLVAFKPGAHWSYFPSLGEIAVSAGLVALEVIAYIVIVKLFPILSGTSEARPGVRLPPGAAVPRRLSA